MAEARTRAGDHPAALEIVERAARRLGRVSDEAAAVPLLHRARAMALSGLGQPTEARAALDLALSTARAREADGEVLRCLDLLVAMFGEDAEVVAWSTERARIGARIGLAADFGDQDGVLV